MNRLDLILRTRSLVRDLSNSFFRESDVIDYLNEGIERIGQVLPELADTPLLLNRTQDLTRIPKPYHHILSLYAAARLCSQDERHYQAGTFMNEFETKLATLVQDVMNGDVVICDENGNVIEPFQNIDHVRNDYFYVNGMVRDYKENKKRNPFSDVETVGE